MSRVFKNLFVILILFSIFYLFQKTENIRQSPKAPLFELPQVDQNHMLGRVLLESLKYDFIILNFWASWCELCEKEKPLLVDWHSKLKSRGNVLFIGIASEEKLQKIYDSNKLQNLPYMNLFDKNSAVAQKYGVAFLPQTLLLNSKKEIIWRHKGVLDLPAIDLMEKKIKGELD